MSYYRPAFHPMRVVALYFCCDLGLSIRILIQAAERLWPEGVIRGTLFGVFHKAPCFKG